jgi:putative phage-type endonuclease
MAYLLQRTDAWFKARRGKLTASNFSAALGISPYTSRKKLVRTMGGSGSGGGGGSFNAACHYGTENEANGLMEYMTQTGHVVQTEFFVAHPYLDWLGGSPDGLVGNDGMIEIKCPFKGELYEGVPLYYYPQVNGLMEICERDWCDFVVWTPEKISITRLKRNKEAFNALLPKYAEIYAMFQRGEEPSRMCSEDKKDMNDLIKYFIGQDIIDPNPPVVPSDLQLYLSEEAVVTHVHKKARVDTWMHELQV